MPAAQALAGLTLEDVLANRTAAEASRNRLSSTGHRRTLLDIIREDESNKKDRRSWKAFKDKLRLKRAGAAWTSSIVIPASDIPLTIQHPKHLSQAPRRSSVRILTFSAADVTTHYMADPPYDDVVKPPSEPAPTFTRTTSTRQVGDASFDEKLGRPNSARLAAAVRADSIRRERVVTFRDNLEDDEDDDGCSFGRPKEERQMSAREAVAAQEAAEAAAAAANEEDEEEEEEEEEESGARGGAVTMSLMDLLEETDRQMGLEGSRYRMEDDDEECEEDEEEEEGEAEVDCCVCMVKHRGAAFVPCGHAFCRMCSRELTVTKANCPLCNNFILEILEVF